MTGYDRSVGRESVNVLLAFPLARQIGSELLADLQSDDRRTRRQALGLVETMPLDFRPQGHEIVRRITARLGPRLPAAALAGEERGRSFLSIDDLDPGVGPPPGLPLFNPYTGVLTLEPETGDDPVAAVAEIRRALASDEAVEGVEPVAAYRAVGEQRVGLSAASQAPAARDTRSLFASLAVGLPIEALLAADTIPWGVEHVGARSGWRRGFSGQGVTVAVLDTGIAPHVDLDPAIRGATFVPGAISFDDDHGHGTHVAGTIAAKAGHAGGVFGVAPGASLMSVQVLARDGWSRGDSVALGITFAANTGARIINLSLGGGEVSQSILRAVIHARCRGALVVAAAGNDYGGPVLQPAALPDLCVAVAATDASNRVGSFCNRGPEVDLAAPGVAIRSTYPGGGYRELNGTSVAVPHVAGAAAILVSRHPDLTPLAIQERLEATALPLGAPDLYGRGLVQVERLTAPLPATGEGGAAA